MSDLKINVIRNKLNKIRKTRGATKLEETFWFIKIKIISINLNNNIIRVNNLLLFTKETRFNKLFFIFILDSLSTKYSFLQISHLLFPEYLIHNSKHSGWTYFAIISWF
jgi:hypothetical protein